MVLHAPVQSAVSRLLDTDLNSDVHGCQLSHQVAEDVGHLNDLHLPSTLTHPTPPAPLGLRECRELGGRALQSGGEDAATLHTDVALYRVREGEEEEEEEEEEEGGGGGGG